MGVCMHVGRWVSQASNGRNRRRPTDTTGATASDPRGLLHVHNPADRAVAATVGREWGQVSTSSSSRRMAARSCYPSSSSIIHQRDSPSSKPSQVPAAADDGSCTVEVSILSSCVDLGGGRASVRIDRVPRSYSRVLSHRQALGSSAGSLSLETRNDAEHEAGELFHAHAQCTHAPSWTHPKPIQTPPTPPNAQPRPRGGSTRPSHAGAGFRVVGPRGGFQTRPTGRGALEPAPSGSSSSIQRPRGPGGRLLVL